MPPLKPITDSVELAKHDQEDSEEDQAARQTIEGRACKCRTSNMSRQQSGQSDFNEDDLGSPTTISSRG